MARPRTIDRPAILDATLALAERSGLDAVTMRAVAHQLGVTPMALYHHVASKQDLLDGLVERLLADLPTPPADLPAVERLAAYGAGLRDVARRHPDAFLMLLRRPASTEAAKEGREGVYAALRDLGVPGDLVPRVERVVSTFMIGWAASEAAGRFAHHPQATLDADLAWALDAALALVGDTISVRGSRD